MKWKIVAVAVLSALLTVGVAHAQIERVSKILAQQKQIREESESSTGAYARFDRDELAKLHSEQDRVFQLLDGVRDVKELRAEQQGQLFNSLEQIKAILTRNEHARQQCWRERKLGSNLPTTRCAMIAEIRRVAEEARQWKGDPEVCIQVPNQISCGRVD